MDSLLLKEVRSYKSVAGIGEQTLPSPAVLAGVNGAGKSHLLRAINEGAIRSSIGGRMIEVEEIVLYDWTDFAVQPPGEASGWRLAQRREQLWTTIRNQLKSGKAGQQIKERSGRLGFDLTEEALLRAPIDTLELSDTDAASVDRERQQIRLKLLEGLNSSNQEMVHAIEDFTGKLILELSERDFSVFASMVGQPVDPLKLKTSELFLAYSAEFEANDYLRLRAQHDGAEVDYLSPEAFQTRYGPPPWDILNDLLADLDLDFGVDRPGSGQDSYDVTLVQKTSGEEVDFGDLSSGEQVLMALAISLYGSGERRHRIQLPKLMLLDEVDAPLHPEMTRMFFRVLDELLVQNGVTVVLATHNPSTVALAPPGSVRRMSKSDPRIVKVTRQQALTHLTSGLTALMPRFDERRVVLVEGDSDADVYTAVLDSLRTYIDAEYGVAFVSAGIRAGEGGSGTVRKHVGNLREAGANSIFGLIDWDRRNDPDKHRGVLVLGHKRRYTLENYILDPVLLIALAVREKFSESVANLDDLLGPRAGTWRGLDRADAALIQKIIDAVLSHMASPDEREGSDSVKVHLIGGQSLEMPRWYLEAPGHGLTGRWHETFPSYRRYQSEDELRKAVLRLVVGDVPQLLSRDFLDVLQPFVQDPALGT